MLFLGITRLAAPVTVTFGNFSEEFKLHDGFSFTRLYGLQK